MDSSSLAKHLAWLVVFPAGHAVHAAWFVVLEYVFVPQITHLFPDTNVPLGHGALQLAALVEPVFPAVDVSAGHAVHAIWPVAPAYEFAGQALRAERVRRAASGASAQRGASTGRRVRK
jgi:hypothetical protein